MNLPELGRLINVSSIFKETFSTSSIGSAIERGGGSHVHALYGERLDETHLSTDNKHDRYLVVIK